MEVSQMALCFKCNDVLESLKSAITISVVMLPVSIPEYTCTCERPASQSDCVRRNTGDAMI